jgi:hypothetical protein
MNETFLTKAKFSKRVENFVCNNRVPYMDAVLELCEENSIDPLDVRKFLSKVVKEKIEAEAIKLNFLKAPNQLPI